MAQPLRSAPTTEPKSAPTPSPRPAPRGPRPSDRLFGLDEAPRGVRVLSDELGARALRPRRLEVAPDLADTLMALAAMALAVLALAGMLTTGGR